MKSNEANETIVRKTPPGGSNPVSSTPAKEPCLRILFLGNSDTDAEIARTELQLAGIPSKVDLAHDRAEFRGFLRRHPYDAVVADMDLPELNVDGILEVIRTLPATLPIVCIGETIAEERVIDLIRSGAVDFLRRDHLERLAPTIRRAVVEGPGFRGGKTSAPNAPPSEELYRSLIEHASDGIFYSDDLGRLTDVNPAGCRLLGYSREEILDQGMTIADVAVVEPESPLRLDDLQVGVPLLVRRDLKRKDGSRLPAEISGTRLAIGGFLGIVRDISERLRAEQALRDKEELFRRIIVESPISTAIVRMDGTIEHINRRAIETFGYVPEDIPDMDRWWTLAYPDEAYRGEVVAGWMGLVGKAISDGGDIERREYQVTCKDRTVKTMMIFGVPVGERVFVMFEDVTKRRRAEDALVESQRELATWHDLVTHDLANFSMTLLGLVEGVLDDDDDPLSAARREMLQRVYRQGFEMQRLAENAKLLARLRAGAVGGPVADAEIAAAIADAIKSVRAVHFDQQVDISVECPPDLRVRGVAFLVNIFLNLLDNAVRHQKKRETGRVEIRVGTAPANPGWIEASIRGGHPPPEEMMPTIFDRYVKGPHSSGSGIGLAAVRGLVIHAGGNIRAHAIGGGDAPVFEVVLDLPSA